MRYTREDGCRAWLAYGMIQPGVMSALLEAFGSGEAVYDRFRQSSSALSAYAGEKQISVLQERSRPDAMHEMMRVMQKLEMGILIPKDDNYPDALRNIPDPPAQLFYRGDPECMSGRCITMVGSRKHSISGMSAARRVAKGLSENGVHVVSGLAMGIDTAALTGALDGGAPAIGVAACGLDVDYPAANHALKEKIVASGGVLISEYPPGLKALPRHFAVRNRIMSGLSSAVLMMECGIRSGSMLTVQHALDQGREVYAYPGEPDTIWSEGAHLLLREGANYFATAEDVLEDMGWLTKKTAAKPSVRELPPLPPDQQRVYELLQRGELSQDQLVASTGMSVSSVSGALTMLQIAKLVVSLPGSVYKAASAV